MIEITRNAENLYLYTKEKLNSFVSQKNADKKRHTQISFEMLIAYLLLAVFTSTLYIQYIWANTTRQAYKVDFMVALQTRAATKRARARDILL